MDQSTVTGMTPGMQFEGFLRVRSADVRTGSNGGKYLNIYLEDVTGIVNGKKWNFAGEPPEAGSIVKVRGAAEDFRGRLQIKIEKLRAATEDDEVDMERLTLPQEEAAQPVPQSAVASRNSSTVAELQPGMKFEGFLLVRASSQREGKTGSRYLDINLVDRTGEINCKMWNGTIAPPPVSSVVWARGQVEEFNGRLQLRLDQLRPRTDVDEVDMSTLIPCAPDSPEHMRGQIMETIGRFESEELKKLTLEMLRMAGDRLDWFPAAQRMHHAERGGLLHHTTDMLRTAEYIIQAYPFLHGDLLRAGVILHDLAKLEEFLSDELGNVQDYSRDGILVGHIVRGAMMVEEAARATGIHGEQVELLEHMILSHHGIPEYGSPRMPMIPEAEVLHWIDTLDARMNEMQAIQERTPEGAFSEKISYLDGRRMYHPFYTEEAE